MVAIGLPRELVDRLKQWNDRYADTRLPFEKNDTEWLRDGQALLAEVRAAVGGAFEVVVTEPWWGEGPSA